jgi:phosphoribosylamine--glycine ligase
MVRVANCDMLDLCYRLAAGSVEGVADVGVAGNAVVVCVTAEGYPDVQILPEPVSVRGFDEAEMHPGVIAFHGLTQQNASGDVVGLGGRVVSVTAFAATRELAAARALDAAQEIDVPGSSYRTDIGAGVTTFAHV